MWCPIIVCSKIIQYIDTLILNDGNTHLKNGEVGRGKGRKGRREEMEGGERGREGRRERYKLEGGGWRAREEKRRKRGMEGRGKPVLSNCIAPCIRGLNQPELEYLQIHQSYVNGMQITPPIPECHCCFLVSIIKSRVCVQYNTCMCLSCNTVLLYTVIYHLCRVLT